MTVVYLKEEQRAALLAALAGDEVKLAAIEKIVKAARKESRDPAGEYKIGELTFYVLGTTPLLYPGRWNPSRYI